MINYFREERLPGYRVGSERIDSTFAEDAERRGGIRHHSPVELIQLSRIVYFERYWCVQLASPGFLPRP